MEMTGGLHSPVTLILGKQTPVCNQSGHGSEEKNLCLCQKLNHGHSTHSLITKVILPQYSVGIKSFLQI